MMFKALFGFEDDSVTWCALRDLEDHVGALGPEGRRFFRNLIRKKKGKCLAKFKDILTAERLDEFRTRIAATQAALSPWRLLRLCVFKLKPVLAGLQLRAAETAYAPAAAGAKEAADSFKTGLKHLKRQRM